MIMRMIILSKMYVLSFLIFNSMSFNMAEYDSRIYFDGPFSRGNNHRDRSVPATNTTLEEMEIQLAREYSQIENFQDLLNRIDGVPDDVKFAATIIGSRIAEEERSNAEKPKPASCIPELQPVSLKNSSTSSSESYLPSCTRVPRCGGCCGHPSLSCQPTATVVRHFQVIVAELNPENKMYYKRKQIVPILEHTKCECDCRIKAEDCNERQIYNKMECRCACENKDEESKCHKSNETKYWDDHSCHCKCRGSTECTTGSYFDQNTCSCKRIGTGGGGGNERRQIARENMRPGFNSGENDDHYSNDNSYGKVPPVYTINADDPRRKHREDPEN